MSNSSPILSIIIPFFNNENFIIPCLESLFHQIDDHIEVVIIDDGSTDNSANLVQNFLAKISHTNVKFISQNNGGIAFVRNVGLDNSRGEYITFLDGDDLLSRNYMKALRPHLASGEFDLIDFNYERFTLRPSDPIVNENVPCVPYDFEQRGLNCMETLFTKSMWHLWNRIYRRSLFDKERFEIGRRYEDVILTPFLYFKTQKIARIDQILYFYRDNHHGITRNIKEKDIEDMLFAMKKMISMAQRQPENTALRGLAARMIANCFSEVKSMSKAVYGYYYYKKETVEVFREAALLCTGTAVPGKKIGQMRYPQIDTLFSRVRLRIKKR